MMQVLLQTNGPLPRSATFTPPGDGPATLYISGSVWTQTPESVVGITVSVDGVPVGSAWVYANVAASHMAVVPVFTTITLPDGASTHQITISALNNATVTDLNDNFQVALLL